MGWLASLDHGRLEAWVKVLIMGCGRVGALVASTLCARGDDVRIMDTDPESFRLLPLELRERIAFNGDATSEEVLRAAGIEEAEVFVAVSPRDNRNALAAQMAKYVFGVPRVVCRINEPQRQEMYQKLGLEAVSPTRLISNMIVDTIHP